MAQEKSPIKAPKDDYTLAELIEALCEIRDKDPEVYGKKKVVLKTPGSRLYPNASYKVVVDPSYKIEQDKRIQIWPGGYVL